MLKAILASAAARKGKHCDNGLRGYKQSPEHIENRRRAQIGKKLSLEARQKLSHSRKGIVFSESHRQKLAIARKRLWDEGKLTAFRSKLEKRLGQVVEPLGYIPQFRIPGYNHPYDYGHPEKKIVIEVHGCFWHSHGCGVRQCKDNSKERDRLHEEVARELGFEIFTFWQCQESDWPTQLKEYGLLLE
jgi:DNA mismatch endonuclease (patch repair protein)